MFFYRQSYSIVHLFSTSEMACVVSGGALNSTHSLTHSLVHLVVFSADKHAIAV